MQPLTGRKDCFIFSAISGVWYRTWLLSAAYEMSVEAMIGRTLPSYFCCRKNPSSYMEPETAFLENLGKYTGKEKKGSVCVGGGNILNLNVTVISQARIILS